MLKLSKKIIASVLAASMIAGTAVQSSAYVWYSSSNEVYYHSSPPEIKLQKIYTYGSFTTANVQNWISFASIDWSTDDDAPIPNTFNTTLGAGGTISVLAGKPGTLVNQHGASLISENGTVRNGVTILSTYPSSAVTIQVNGSTKTVKREGNATVYIANKLSSGSFKNSAGITYSYSSRSETGHKNTIKHEIGHALGYVGHSTSNADVMRSTTSNNSMMFVSDHDREHLHQILVDFTDQFSNNELNAESIAFSKNTIYKNNIGRNMDFVKFTTSFASNVITGTPIEIVNGTLDILDENDENCEILITDYKFKVSRYDYGYEGDNIITVRSQVGNIFELGKEYTFSTDRINNTLYNLYTVNSRKWIVDHENYNPKEISEFRSTLSKLETERKARYTSAHEPKVAETAEASKEFISSNVDIAFIATITELEEDEQNDIYDIKVSNVKYLKGSVKKDILNNGLRIKGDIKIGGTYLMLFTEESDEYIMMSARNNSIIDVNSSEYDKFAKALKVI